jgi:carbonic anhydrase
MISAQEALRRLRDGNRRFVSGAPANDAFANQSRRAALAEGQQPLAIVLGCSDSRVPAEIVFDQGLGDLFVIRVAGNVVAPSQVGSVEFAAERFGTPLVVVLGHSRCGAILATLEELVRPTQEQSRNLRSIVDRIRPSVEPLLATDVGHDPETLVRLAVRANVSASANHLRHGSEVLELLIQKGKLLVVGGEYSLETGLVEFFDGVEGVPLSASAASGEVVLRNVVEDDLPVLFEHQLDPDATRMAAFPSRDRDAFMGHWAKIVGNAELVAKTILVNGEIAGNVVSFEQEAKRLVGYWIGKEFWGRGIATRALRLLLGEVTARPLYAYVAKHNVGSVRVLQKCGFEVSREEQVSVRGQRIDELLMVLD